MSEIKIDKKIPLPAMSHGNSKYPWRQMEIGDSFAFPKNDVARARSSAYEATQRFKPKKFKAALDNTKTIRIWRIK